MRVARPEAVGLVALLLVISLAACGRDTAAEPVALALDDDSLAALAVLDTITAHRAVDAEEYLAALDGQPLAVGDGVRTDETGFAEVAYADGSLTRLGPSTDFEIVELAGDATVPQIRVRLDVGRTWHRVGKVTGQRGRFEVETSVAVATVRGTSFAVVCLVRDVCTFTVFEGVVEVTTSAGERLDLDQGEQATIGPRGEDPDAGGPGGEAGDDGGDGGGAGTDGSTNGDGATDAADTGSGGGDTATTGSAPTGTSDGSTATGDDARGPVVVLDRSPAGLDDVGEQTWVGQNVADDEDLGRFGGDLEACSVTVDGRNVDYAATPDTALQISVDDAAVVRAVATGPIDDYRVELRMAGLSVEAARGEVVPDDAGDRSTFAGSVDVSEYAAWGVGLYEIRATTTGTRCVTTAFVNVMGRSPLTTGTGLLALVAGLLGAFMVNSAVRQVTSGGTDLDTGGDAGDAGDDVAPTDGETTLWSRMTALFRSWR